MNCTQLVRMIDHTILKAEATEAEVRKVVAEAIEESFCLRVRQWPVGQSRERSSRQRRGGRSGKNEPVLSRACCRPSRQSRIVRRSRRLKRPVGVKDGAQEIDMGISMPDVMGIWIIA